MGRRFLRTKAHNRAPCNQDGRQYDEHNLHQSGQCLRLAMAETVVVIGGHRGVTDAEKRKQRGKNVKAGVC